MLNSYVNFYPLLDYVEALQLQKDWHQKVLVSDVDWALLGLEHSPVITVGKRGAFAEEMQQEQWADKGYRLLQTDRGGQTTMHQPGQLVIYPIFPLRRFGMGVKTYVDVLLQTTSEILASYNIQTFTKLESPGLYTKQGKIAFIGIRVENGVSRHGISLNINNPIEDFSMITSCGVKEARLDKISYYSSELTSFSVFTEWHNLFIKKLSSPKDSTVSVR